MRCMFNWRQIPKMMELKELLLTTVAEHPEWSQEEKGNLLGECDLILSFLMYNDISAMSRLHRSASAQMSHPASSIQNSGGWTFGSPSVLMMFHRQPGQLDRELAEMDECMPTIIRSPTGTAWGRRPSCGQKRICKQGAVRLDAQDPAGSVPMHQIEGTVRPT